MSLFEEPDPVSDPSLNSFENHLRRFSPSPVDLDVEIFLNARGPDRQSVLHQSASMEPVSVGLPVTGPTGSPWPLVGGAWLGGMLSGALLMFVLITNRQPSSPNRFGESLTESSGLTSIQSPAQPPLVSSLKPVENRNTLEPFAFDPFADVAFDDAMELPSPRRWLAYYRPIFGESTLRGQRTLNDKSIRESVQSNRNDSRSGSTEQGSPVDDYRLEIHLPPTAPNVNRQFLTQQLLNESL